MSERRLSGKQRKFIDAYLGEANFNATRAAELAGYRGNGNTLANIGYENVRKREIVNEIEKRLKENAMSANEALMRLGEQARSEYSKYIDNEGTVHLNELMADGKSHLIKGVKETKYGKQIEFYDGQAALVNVLKHHGLLVNRIDQHTTNIEVDLSTLTDDQLKRLAAGENIASILSDK